MKKLLVGFLMSIFLGTSYASEECVVYVPVDDHFVGIHAIFVLNAKNTTEGDSPKLIIEADDGKRNLEIVVRMESTAEAEYASKRITEMVKTCKRRLT